MQLANAAERIPLGREYFFARMQALLFVNGMRSVRKECYCPNCWGHASTIENRRTNHHGHLGFGRHIS